MHDDDEPTLAGNKFWTARKILFAVIFIAGFVAGTLFTNKVLDQQAIQIQAADSNSLLEKNNALDTRNDTFYRCLREYDIEPDSCKP